MKMDKKRKQTDTEVGDNQKKRKLQERGKFSSAQSPTKQQKIQNKKKKPKHIGGNKEKNKSLENDILRKNKTVSSENGKKDVNLDRKDVPQKKKYRKKKHSKSSKMEQSGKKNLAGEKEQGSEKPVNISADLKHGKTKTAENLENDLKSKSQWLKQKKRKRKMKEKANSSVEETHKNHKIDGVQTPNKIAVLKKSNDLNTSSSKEKTSNVNMAKSNFTKKERTPLTDRQKHKRQKLKMKRKLKRLSNGQIEAKKETVDADVSKKTVESSKDSKPTFEKMVLPKGPEDASTNWKKLQITLEAKKPKKQRKGPKPKPHPLRRISETDNNKELNGGKKELSEEPQKTKKSAPDIWFHDVDEIYLEPAARSKLSTPMEQETTGEPAGSNTEKSSAVKNPLVKPDAYKGLTKAISMDCEMVGVGNGNESMLARVSMVNQHGEMVYDTFVKPMEDVVDYRTHVSGVRKEDIEKGEEFSKVQKKVAEILKGRLLVGHALMNDLKVLFLSHPKKRIRDTSIYKPFRQLFQGRTPSLKKLTAQVLNVKVQEGEHNSVQDAQAAMRLYTMYRKQWEAEIGRKRKQLEEKVKHKQLPVVDPASKKSVFQKNRDRKVLDRRKIDRKSHKK